MIDSVADKENADDKTARNKIAGSKNSRPLIERLEALVQNPTVSKLLTPASFVYGAGSYLRILSFSTGLVRRSFAGVPVVSIGNVTVGGTGKTPVVIDLADRLSSQGLNVAILSRGYGRRSKAKTVVVSSGAGPIVSVDDSGDEPYMMARAVPAATVIVGTKRTDTARLATEQYGAQIILLDDGFQHVQLKRDFDIVLFDYNDDPESMTLLPRGRLREPLAALGRATAIIITKIPASGGRNTFDAGVKKKLDHLHSLLSALAPSAVLYRSSFRPSYLLTDLGDLADLAALANTNKSSNVVKLAALAGKKVFALCGIARPQGFFDSLIELGAEISDQMTFCDHHWFTAEDVEEIDRRFRASKAAYIVTSEKDRVRLPLPADLSALTYTLMLEPVWLDDGGAQVSTPDFVGRIMALTERVPE